MAVGLADPDDPVQHPVRPGVGELVGRPVDDHGHLVLQLTVGDGSVVLGGDLLKDDDGSLRFPLGDGAIGLRLVRRGSYIGQRRLHSDRGSSRS